MSLISISLVSLLAAASWQDDHRNGLAALRDGQYARAAALLESAVAGAERDHASLLWLGRVRNNYASALYQSGRYRDAEDGFNGALREWAKTPESTPQERARTHNNLAVLYRQWWRLDDASVHARKALDLDHAALFWHTLGEILRFQGRYDESIKALDEAEGAGPDPVERGTILQARAGVAMERDDPAQAEALYRRAITELGKSYAENHPAVLAAKGNLGVALIALRKWEEAEPLLSAVYRDARASLGDAHPRVAAAANNIAQLYRAQKRYREADDFYRQALSIWKLAFGEKHPEYAKGLHNLGSLFVEQGKLQGAEKLYGEALRIAEASLGHNHAQTRMHASGLEQVYRFQKRVAELDRLRRSFQ
ncbi:MAG: tetratricopeptide repeat protein [Acidobacteria bacterium]|nr:tetratricopeptide repeat protein [Acidobacteriota bacterium]